MPLTRLVYVSRTSIDTTRSSMTHQINQILRVSTINNEARDITGALIFDRDCFVQVLEGRLEQVWATFRHIAPDPWHTDVQFVEMVAVPQRLFGNWWMGSGERNRTTAPTFAPYLRDGQFRPADMAGPEILALLRDMARLGYARELAPAIADYVVPSSFLSGVLGTLGGMAASGAGTPGGRIGDSGRAAAGCKITQHQCLAEYIPRTLADLLIDRLSTIRASSWNYQSPRRQVLNETRIVSVWAQYMT